MDLKSFSVTFTTISMVVLLVGAQQCPPGWTGDAPAALNVPISPPVNTTTRTLELPKTLDRWTGVSGWGGATDSNYEVPWSAPRTLTLTTVSWYSGPLRLYGTNMYAFQKARASTFSFKPKISGAPPSSFSITKISLLVLSSPPLTWDKKLDIRVWNMNSTNSPLIVHREDLTGASIPVMDGSQTVSFTLPTSSADFGGYFMVELFLSTGTSAVWQMQFQELKFKSEFIVPSSVPFPGSTSESVTVYRMSSTLDPNPRTSDKCPHMASGLKHWHEGTTWPSGSVPSFSSSISLPPNTSVLISSCSLFPPPAVYERIHVPPTSKLIFSDSNIAFRVKNIFVEGQLHMGGPECRLNGKIDIEFVGAKSTADSIAPLFGSKGIGVTGSIDMHGRQFNPTWTRLGSSIFPGQDVIMVQRENNWEVGQKIVVTTSAYRDLGAEDFNEVRTIKAIDKSGRRIEVTEAFNYYHYAGYEHSCEVGLLSRRITLRGDEESEVEQFGGQVRVTGEGRFAGVKAERMGQKNMLGKYPFHFHAMGPSPTSFVKDCSITNSYFRCVAIHQTNETSVLRNVAFNATAHCFYLEDGVEEKNTINYNLAARIHTIGKPMGGGSQSGETTNENPTSLILPADAAASGFYITNAYNSFTGNAASGGWAGFSFPGLPKPIGLSKNWKMSMEPQQRPTLLFTGNTAHSSGNTWEGGGCMYVGGKLWYPEEASSLLRYNSGRFSRNTLNAAGTGPGIQYFNDSKTWLCHIGVSHWGDRVEVISHESHDDGRSVQVFGDGFFSKALVNAKSNSLTRSEDVTNAFQFYDTWVKSLITNVVFRGFNPNSPPWDMASSTNLYAWEDKRVITALLHSDRYKPQAISATKNLTFSNSARSQWLGHKWLENGSSRYFNFVDWDGTFGGTPGVAQIVGSGKSGWWHWHASCTYEPQWLVHRCPRADRQVVHLDLFIPPEFMVAGNDVEPLAARIGQTHLFGPGLPPGPHNATLTRNPGVSGISKLGWYFHIALGSPKTFKIVPGLFPPGQWVLLAFKYPPGSTFSIKLTTNWGYAPIVTLTAASSVADVLASPNSSKFYFDGTHLYFKALNPMSNSANGFTRDGVTIWSISNGAWLDIDVSCPGLSGIWCPSGSSQIPTVSW